MLTPEKLLAAAVAKEKVKDWTRLQIRKGRSYRFENPDLPTLQPWTNRPIRRPTATFSSVTPIITRSTRTACSCPMSTRS